MAWVKQEVYSAVKSSMFQSSKGPSLKEDQQPRRKRRRNECTSADEELLQRLAPRHSFVALSLPRSAQCSGCHKVSTHTDKSTDCLRLQGFHTHTHTRLPQERREKTKAETNVHVRAQSRQTDEDIKSGQDLVHVAAMKRNQMTRNNR